MKETSGEKGEDDNDRQGDINGGIIIACIEITPFFWGCVHQLQAILR